MLIIKGWKSLISWALIIKYCQEFEGGTASPCFLFVVFFFFFFVCLMHSHPHHFLRNSGEGCPTSHTWAQAWDIALLTEEILWIHSPILVKSETCGKPKTCWVPLPWHTSACPSAHQVSRAAQGNSGQSWIPQMSDNHFLLKNKLSPRSFVLQVCCKYLF